jgi:hypothetical protein
MNRRVLALLLAGTLTLGQAGAVQLAISPLVDQPVRNEAVEDRAPPPVRAVSPTGPGGRELPANPLWAIPLKQLSNTRERPIFSPSRRALFLTVVGPSAVPPPPRVVPKSVGPSNPELALIGTVIGDREAIAVFVDDTTKNPLRLRTGEAHKGWALRSVKGREATLEKDTETVVLSLPQPGLGQPGSMRSSSANRADVRPDDRSVNRRR